MDERRFDPRDYVELALHTQCNLRCVHCMIEGTMDWMRPVSVDQFEQVLALNAQQGRWRGITLTGAEITLHRDLPDLARRARAAGFAHVQLQTHGMRLADPAFVDTLVEAGVDEYFVSVTAADAATHDAITQVPGSFERTLAGLAELDRRPGVAILTNTVVTRRSVHQLAAVVDRLAPLQRLARMEFWGYWPMHERDVRGLTVSHLQALPALRAAIQRARALGRQALVKNYPECLLGELGDALDNRQPESLIDPAFWAEFHRNGFHQCVHRAACASTRCQGLTTAYVAEHGWHADELLPLLAAPECGPESTPQPMAEPPR